MKICYIDAKNTYEINLSVVQHVMAIFIDIVIFLALKCFKITGIWYGLISFIIGWILQPFYMPKIDLICRR